MERKRAYFCVPTELNIVGCVRCSSETCSRGSYCHSVEEIRKQWRASIGKYTRFVHFNHDNQGCGSHASSVAVKGSGKTTLAKTQKGSSGSKGEHGEHVICKWLGWRRRGFCVGQPMLETPFAHGKREALLLPPRACLESHGTWKSSLISGVFSYKIGWGHLKMG